MFLTPTVLLVGAGASAEFGLPTGVGIYREASSEDEKLRSKSGARTDIFLSTFWEFLRFHNLHAEQRAFRQLANKLKQSHAFSIDLYSFYNPDEAEIAKLFTAWRLIKDMFAVVKQRNEYRELEWYLERSYRWRTPTVSSGSNIRNNWIGELSNLWLSGARSIDDLAKNQLTIVTFNYDPILEETFPWVVRSHNRFQETPNELLPNLIHVHGSIGSLAEEDLNLKTYRAVSENIKFITDTLDAPTEAVDAARKALLAADRIYSVGFAFEQLNLDLLEANIWGARTVALNFDGNIKVSNSMRRVGVQSKNIMSGTEDKPLPVGLAASRGFFES